MVLKNRFLVLFSLLVFSCNFLVAQPSWVQSNGFKGASRSNAVSFTLNGKGYVGLGANDTTLFTDFWQYDPVTKYWTKVADFGGEGRRDAVAFVLNDKAYVGLGQSGIYPDFTLHKDFWVYDPVANSWTETTAFAGSARHKSIAFTLEGKGFVMLGQDDSGYPIDVWTFDPVSKTWTEKNEFTDEGRIGAFVFNLNDTIYVGHGVNYEGGSTNIQNNYLSYDAATDSWSEIDILPSEITIRNNIFYFSLKGKGYFGGGTNGNETWEYDPTENTWTEAGNVGNLSYNLSSSTAFVIDTVAHLATGYFSYSPQGTYVKDFFKFGEGLIIPERPSDVLAKIISTTAIEISWKDNSDDEVGFIVERSKSTPGNYKPIATVAPNVTHYVDEDSALELDVEYFYQIRAYNDGISLSPFYDRIIFEYPYKAPTNLTVNDNAANQVKLSWTDNAHLEDGFIIERSVNDTLSWEVIDSVEVDITEYFDKTVSPQTLVYYRVKAFYDAETTDYTNIGAAYLDEIGTWLKIGEFPGTARNDYFTFTIGNKLYLGTGIASPEILKDFWVYDLDNNTWDQLLDFPGNARYLSTAFSINGKGYVGLGEGGDGENVNFKDFWQYDPASGEWTQVSNFPGIENHGAYSFVINNKAYVRTGLDANTLKYKDFWEYDPATDEWTQKQDFPDIGGNQGIAASANGLGYIGLGYSNFSSDTHHYFYAYDPNSDTWEQKAEIPFAFDYWAGAFATTNSSDYIIAGTGLIDDLNVKYNKLWKYDIAADQWVPWGRFPVSTAHQAGFIYDGHMYATAINAENKLEIYQHIDGAPASPANFMVDAKLDTAFLQWEDQSAKETGFVIERKEYLDTIYQTVSTTEANENHFTDLLPEDGKKYVYRIKSINDAGSSEYVETESAWLPLKAPDSLSFSSTGGNNLTLTWVNRSDNAEEIEIYISEDSLQFEQDGVREPGDSYSNWWLKENSTYYFKVRASAYYPYPYSKELFSDYVSVSQKTLLYEPEDVATTIAEKGIKISWKDSSEYETGYEIERSIGSEDAFELIHTTGVNKTAYVDTTFEEGVTIYYRVKAISEDNYSVYSKVTDTFAYFAPTEFTATLITADSISFTWKNQSEVAPYIYLKRGIVSDTISAYLFNYSAALDSSKQAYTNYVEENTLYRYALQAHDYNNYSPYSEIIFVHTPLKAPSELTMGGISDGKLQLKWQNNTEAETYSVIIEMAEEGGTFTPIGTLEATADEYWVENLVSGEDYQFRIKIFNDAVSSEYSNVLSALGVPTGLDDEQQEKINVTLFPNPAGSQLKILTEKHINEIKIMDLRGRVVENLEVQADHIYEISSLPQGVYLLSVIANNQTTLIKFVKQ